MFLRALPVTRRGQEAGCASGQETGRAQQKFNCCNADELEWLFLLLGLTEKVENNKMIVKTVEKRIVNAFSLSVRSLSLLSKDNFCQ